MLAIHEGVDGQEPTASASCVREKVLEHVPERHKVMVNLHLRNAIIKHDPGAGGRSLTFPWLQAGPKLLDEIQELEDEEDEAE